MSTPGTYQETGKQECRYCGRICFTDRYERLEEHESPPKQMCKGSRVSAYKMSRDMEHLEMIRKFGK